MWLVQSTVLRGIVRRIIFSSRTVSNTSSFCTRSVKPISPSFSCTSFHKTVSIGMPRFRLHYHKITRKKFQSSDKGFPQNISAIGNGIFLNMMLCVNVTSVPLLPSHQPFSVLRYVRNAISTNPLNKKYFSLANHNNQYENNHFKL
jgi:hypothetical protein